MMRSRQLGGILVLINMIFLVVSIIYFGLGIMKQLNSKPLGFAAMAAMFFVIAEILDRRFR